MFSLSDPGFYRTGRLLFCPGADSQGISGLLEHIQKKKNSCKLVAYREKYLYYFNSLSSFENSVFLSCL